MNTSSSSKSTSGPLTLAASQQLIIAFEVGGGQPYYDKKLSFPTQPTPGSGVTIGIGYDLSQVARPDLTTDWTGKLSDTILIRLGTAIGLSGQRAANRLPSLRDIRIPWENALAVFRQRTLPGIMADTRRIYPQVAALAPECQASLYSLVYNRGIRLIGPTRTEMRDIQSALQAGQPARIPSLLRSMKRLWIGQPGGPGLILRREAEATVFEKGLAKEPEMIS